MLASSLTSVLVALSLATPPVQSALQVSAVVPTAHPVPGSMAELESSASAVAERGMIGIYMGDSAGEAVVQETMAGGPAAEAGLVAGDAIRAVNGVVVASAADLSARISQHSAGESVKLTIERDGWRKDIELVLAAASLLEQDSAELEVVEGEPMRVRLFAADGSEEEVELVLGDLSWELDDFGVEEECCEIEEGVEVIECEGSVESCEAPVAECELGQVRGDHPMVYFHPEGGIIEIELVGDGAAHSWSWSTVSGDECEDHCCDDEDECGERWCDDDRGECEDRCCDDEDECDERWCDDDRGECEDRCCDDDEDECEDRCCDDDEDECDERWCDDDRGECEDRCCDDDEDECDERWCEDDGGAWGARGCDDPVCASGRCPLEQSPARGGRGQWVRSRRALPMLAERRLAQVGRRQRASQPRQRGGRWSQAGRMPARGARPGQGDGRVGRPQQPGAQSEVEALRREVRQLRREMEEMKKFLQGANRGR
jgi:hypothetical protein